jgi:hypothetical protein
VIIYLLWLLLNLQIVFVTELANVVIEQVACQVSVRIVFLLLLIVSIESFVQSAAFHNPIE